ncbi:hypothetical protein EBR43_08150 [bacterium]|jgi:uncharacterized Rmd1/YagE family protein|nr:hypothetical protein [bacterium]NBW57740.1 hypothetical protein [bacterium]NBX71421.1 hypothetical protein [bacterium]
MRNCSICTAESYKIDDLSKYLRSEGYEPKFYDDIIHIEKYREDEAWPVGDIFIFPYGCFVTWGLDEDEDEQIVHLVSNFQINPTVAAFKDVAFFVISNNPEEEPVINEEDDEIILPMNDPLVKLSFSHGLSQSVKLNSFEQSISITIDNTRHLPQELAKKGRIPLSSIEIAKLMGHLFAQRDAMNLDSDILDTPEFFWRRPKYEPYYLMASNYLDIQARVAILNRKLDRVHELYDILSNEHKHLHSTRLEVVVIILIMIEVFFTLFREWDLLIVFFSKLIP